MKIAAAQADRFCAHPDPSAVAVLLYGPDAGLARERAERLARTVVADLADPFRVCDLAAASVAEDPALLADEAAALAFGGGRRVIRVRGAGNAHAPAFDRLLDRPLGDALIIVEAGELGPASALRKLFESAGNAAAVPCYRDEGEALITVIRDALAGHGLTADAGALAFLASRLGSDRKLTRAEIDKLALYVGGAREVTAEDAIACVGDAAAITLDDLADAVAGGDHAHAVRALARLRLDGVAPITVLRALQRHFQQLHLALAAIAGGASAEDAVAGLRPPLFFKRRPAFRSQLRRWPAATVAAALDLLLEAEIDCKTTGVPAHAMCGQAVIRLTRGGARGAG